MARVSYAARTKYDEPGRAARYAGRSPDRAAKEWRLLARCLDALPRPPASALDVPCGVGRIGARLAARGIPTTLADLSPAMRAEAEARVGGAENVLGVRALDLETLETLETLQAGGADALAADLVVCFRFLHHLPDAASRARVLRSLRRLTRSDLLLSFHHPVSAHQGTRLLRRLFGGGPSDRHVIAPRRLAREAAEAGLRVVRWRALAPWRRELWVAHLVPVASQGAP